MQVFVVLFKSRTVTERSCFVKVLETFGDNQSLNQRLFAKPEITTKGVSKLFVHSGEKQLNLWDSRKNSAGTEAASGGAEPSALTR